MDSLVLVGAIFGIVAIVYGIVAQINIDQLPQKTEELEKKTGFLYNHTMRDRTKSLQVLTAACFAGIPSFVWLIVGQFYAYSGPWWIPLITSLPSMVFSLIFALGLHISMNPGTREAFTAIRNDALGTFSPKALLLFLASYIIGPVLAVLLEGTAAINLVYIEMAIPMAMFFSLFTFSEFLTYKPNQSEFDQFKLDYT